MDMGLLEHASFQHSNTSLERWGEVEAEVKRHFEEAHLSEAFVDRRTYAIPQSTVSSLSTAFTSLEKCKFGVTQSHSNADNVQRRY